MSKPIATPITRLVLDFDGTCTRVERIADAYLEAYRTGLGAYLEVSEDDWHAALRAVRSMSPRIGWTVAGSPSAPAAADPYILAYEAAHFLRRRAGSDADIPVAVHAEAYAACPAAWRKDARTVLEAVASTGAEIWFVSNSGTAYIESRLNELLGPGDPLRSAIKVQSDAGKFRICELPWEEDALLDPAARDLFAHIPPAVPSAELDRPIYLRRGSYFHALSRVFAGDFTALSATLFCGDIWELDLAMPRQLGARVHLLDRAAPFETCDYERHLVLSEAPWARGGVELESVLSWFEPS